MRSPVPSADHYVIETRSDQLAFSNVVRCAPRRMADFHDSMGKPVLLHAPRDTENKGYFGEAVIDGYEPDPRRQGMFVFLTEVKLYCEPVSTAVNGEAREDVLLGGAGPAAFHFYANGLRPISRERFQDIVDAAGQNYAARAGLAEDLYPSNTTADPRSITEETIIARWRFEERRVRARHRAHLIQRLGAYCCMSGASFDVPDGLSLLQVSHYRPLGHGGPDQLTNVGLMTANIHPIYEDGLVTIRRDYSLRFAPDIPEGFLAEFRGRTQLSVSGDLALDPAETNLEYHREEIFMRRLKQRGLSLADR